MLIHCSDGWDRTTKLSALAQLILDPFYRTIKGFVILIEKEWLSFGHQFAYRNGYYTEELSEEQTSPVFLQWLDCVYQLLNQFPNAFQFNIDFLVYLASHHNTCLYGTFLFNSEKERKHFNAKFETLSIWSYIFKPEIYKTFTNPYYNNSQTDLENISSSIVSLRLWEEYYLKYHRENVISELDFSLSRNKNSRKYFEHVKREDDNKIKMQKKEIENYKNAIKDISFLLTESELCGKIKIPESFQSYIDKLNIVQKCDDAVSTNVINMLEDYI